MAEDPKQPARTMIGWLPNAPQPAAPPRAPQNAAPQAPAPPGYPPQQFGQQTYGSGQQSHSPQPAQGQPPQPGYGQPASYGQPGHAPPQPPPYAPQGYPPQGYPQAPGYPQAQGYPQPQGFGYSPQGYPQQRYPQQTPAAHGYPQAQGYAQGGYGHAAAAAAPSEPRMQRPIPDASATVGVSDRVSFIRQTYLHLLGAIGVFAGLLYLLMTNETLGAKVSRPLFEFAIGARWHWAVVLAAFVGVSWIADAWARSASSRAMQYIGLGIYVVAEALIFVPLLAIVMIKTYDIVARGGHEPHILRDAALATGAVFVALTASVFITKKDFSWMRSGLMVAGAASVVLVGLSLGFGFNLGIVFSIGMVLLAAGQILYQTSQVLAHYDPRQHVAAALALFSSVALMFWYVIRILMRMRQ